MVSRNSENFNKIEDIPSTLDSETQNLESEADEQTGDSQVSNAEPPESSEDTKICVKEESVRKSEPEDGKNEESSSSAVDSVKEEVKVEGSKPDVELFSVKSDLKPKDALLSLQQMDEAMAKLGAANLDPMVTTEPTVAQLLAQSAANPIKWPKERAIQNRVEHIMYAVEKNRWPVDKYFQTTDSESRDLMMHHHQQLQHQHQQQQLQQQHQQQLHESERRAVDAELERAQLHALLHPNLHHTLGLNKGALRSFLESEGRDKLSQSDSNALRQLPCRGHWT
jgi:chromodomain-helicase-DNA-binding protein 7